MYYNYDQYTGSNISTAWGNENLQSNYGGIDRSEVPVYPYLGLAKTEYVNAGCSSCGGSTSGGMIYDYYYMNLNSGTSTDPNVVVHLTVIDAKNSFGNPIFRTIYALNNDGHELRRAMIENPTAATLNVVCISKKLNASGEVIEERPADAHALVNTNALLTQFLNPYNGSSWANDTATLEPSKGIIIVTEYDAVTNKKSGSKVKIGSGGTAYYINATNYNAEGHISAQYIYPTQTTNRNTFAKLPQLQYHFAKQERLVLFRFSS